MSEAFDVEIILEDWDALPVEPLPDLELAMAVLNDVLRKAGRAPVADATWQTWQRERSELWRGQMSALAHFLQHSRELYDTALSCLSRAEDRRPSLPDFFDTIAPLTAAMLLENRFRQEELLRRFAAWCEGRIEGESEAQEKKRLDHLDYRKTLREFEKAEAARKEEEAKRLRALEEARRREQASRGWRE